jgi:hypothetical protein
MVHRLSSTVQEFDARVDECARILEADPHLTLSDCAQVQAQLPTGTAELVAVEMHMAKLIGDKPNQGREDTFTRTVYAVASSLRKGNPTREELRHALSLTTGDTPIVTVLALQKVLTEMEAN